MSDETVSIETAPSGDAELVRRWAASGDAWLSVLIVHGLGEHSGRYRKTASTLSAAGIDVVAFDLLGFGETGGSRADIEDWNLYLDQIKRHIVALEGGEVPVALLGHSMGGLLGLEYCLGERPPPDALVLSAPALSGGKAWQRAIAPVLGRLFPKLATPNAINGEQLSRDPAVGAAYFADPLVLTKTTARLGGELFAAMERCRSRFSALRVPTLVVHGGADTLVSPQSSAPLAELDLVKRVLFPRLRHEAFNEPEGPEVLAEVVTWLEETVTNGG